MIGKNLKLKVVKNDGSSLGTWAEFTGAGNHSVALESNPPSTLWRRVEVKFNSIVVSDTSYHHYRCFLEKLINYNTTDARDGFLELTGFVPWYDPAEITGGSFKKGDGMNSIPKTPYKLQQVTFKAESNTNDVEFLYPGIKNEHFYAKSYYLPGSLEQEFVDLR